MLLAISQHCFRFVAVHKDILMEPRGRNSTKFRSWCWAISVFGVVLLVLGVLSWWKSRSERLQFVEPIWSDSLVAHETHVAEGERQKIGEIWALTSTTGMRLLGRGLSRRFEGQFPVFLGSNALHQLVSDQLLSEHRRTVSNVKAVTWPEWWEYAKASRPSSTSSFACEVVFVGPKAISVCQSISECVGGGRHLFGLHGRSFVNLAGEVHEVKFDELFHSGDGPAAVSSHCLLDLSRQGAKWVQPSQISKLKMNEFNEIIASSVALTPEGLRIFFSPLVVGPYSDGPYEVFLSYEKLAEHLKPDGPHRLFQSKVDE